MADQFQGYTMSAKEDKEQIERLTGAIRKLVEEFQELSERVENIENGLSQIAEKAQDAKTIEQWKKLVPIMKRHFP
jgi:hypothetical protein